jgi:hypothetical protein
MKPKILTVVCVSSLILAMLAAPAFAHGAVFDGQRKGFILGGGLGGSYLSWDYGDINWTVTANFKVGYAPSNSFEVYWATIVSYIAFDSDDFASGANCIAVTKYLKPEGRGLFFCGGIGLAYTNGLDGAPSHSGFGGFAGLGYDFAKHFYIQADALYSDVDWTPRWGFRLTLNILAF